MRRRLFTALLVMVTWAVSHAQVQTGVYTHGAFQPFNPMHSNGAVGAPWMYEYNHLPPETGTYTQGAFDNGTFDTVNIGNLNVYFSVPVYSKPGRGLPFYFNLAYNSSIWSPSTVSGSGTWAPVLNWGWSADTDAQTGYINSTILVASTCLSGGHHVAYEVWGKYIYVDRMGVVHPFTGLESTNNPTCAGLPGPPYVQTASDGSGLTLTANVGPSGTITTTSDSNVTAPFGAYLGTGATIDSNGNTISVNSSSGVVDTTGNTVVTMSGTAPSPTIYTYSDTTSTPRHVTVTYETMTVQTYFNCSGIAEFGPTSESLISNISYPDGTSYSFSYEPTPNGSGNTTGRLASVTLPGGGMITYLYSGGSNGIECSDGGAAVLTRAMANDPLNPSVMYTRSANGQFSHTEVVDGLSNYGEYDFAIDPTNVPLVPFLVNYSQYQGAATGTPLMNAQICLNNTQGYCGSPLRLPISEITNTTTYNGSAVKKSVQTFNSHGLITDDQEYDFGSGVPGPELAETQYSYTSFNAGMMYRPSSITTLALSGGSMVAINNVNYGYDENSLTTKSGVPQLYSVTGSRGNLTSVKYTTGASSPSSITTSQYWYDNAGQLVTSKDAALNQTTYIYDSATDAFLYGIAYPSTGGPTHSISSTWDAIRGVKLTDKDMNSQQTSYTYDLMLRPSTVTTPDGGYKAYTYSLLPGSPYTSVSIRHTTGSNITATTYLDSYGRTSSTDTTDTGGDDLIAYAYDAGGNVKTVSNPYRTGDTIANTVTQYDALQRPRIITDSDGSQRSLTYSGNSVTFTDEASRQREIFSDGLGRINKALEPDNLNSLTLETDYLYNQNVAAGSGSTFTTFQNIVYQRGGSLSSSNWRTRTSTMDMLGRTTSAATPEAGTITYNYPNSGGSCIANVMQPLIRSDANGTSTNYCYDALYRLTGKSYGGSTIGMGTTAVAYYYDQTSYNGLAAISNGIGRRTGMSDVSGETAWSFDPMGRILTVRKLDNGNTYQANYTYNADGTTNTLQDFGGTTFTYSYDVSGRPTGVVDGSSNTYASGATYNAAGQLTALNHQLTSGGGAYKRTIQYNNRLQPGVIVATLNNNTIQSLTYGYGTSGTNNGNILSITNGMDATRNQSYTYDNLNRLASGKDASHWGESYTYDNWSNLIATARMAGLGGNSWSVSQATANNQLPILTYDAAGEVTTDQSGLINFSYDAEGHILSAGGGTYVYDGDGNRVKKTVSGATTLYWPGAGGLLNESNSTASTWGKQVRFGGLLVWHEDSSGSGRFLFHDQLGSVRITGTAAGTNPPSDDIDYQSFGSIFNNYGSSPSDNHYLFTGDEQDSESGTNYALARNQSPALGRFNRPDPYDGSYDLANPQSLNRYAYVLNNPLFAADPSGLEEQIPGVGGGGGGDDCGDDCSGDCGDDCSGDCGYDCGSAPNDPSNGGQNPNSNDGYPQWDNVWDESLGLPAGSLPAMPGINDILGGIANSLGIPDLTGMDCMPICDLTQAAPSNSSGQYPTRMFGTHWCGPGGAGPVVNQLDAACKAHDKCYDRLGYTALSNYSPLQDDGLQACNQALCDAAKKSTDLGATRVWLYFSLIPKDYCHN